MEAIARANALVVGVVYGTLLWWLLMTINSMHGKINAPWNQNVATVISSLLAFAAFGIIATTVIKRYDSEYAHT